MLVFFILVSTTSVSHAKENEILSPALLKNSFDYRANKLTFTDANHLKSPALVKLFYEDNHWQPVWIENISSRNLVRELLQHLSHVESDGLSGSNYHVDYLKDVLQGNNSTNSENLYTLELLLTDAFITYCNHLLHGQVNPKEIYEDWSMVSTEADVTLILKDALLKDSFEQSRQQLYPVPAVYSELVNALVLYRELSIKYPDKVLAPGPSLKFDDQGERVKILKEKLSILDGPLVIPSDKFDLTTLVALKEFQKRHGLKADGIVGPKTLAALNVPLTSRIEQIQINLERLRWLPRNPGDNYIVVNIADFRLHIIENHQSVMSSKVIVGKRFHETPVFSSNMTYLVLNPYWYVPRSIAINEILPKLRKDSGYLTSKRMRVFDDSTRKEVSPESIEWTKVQAREFGYSFRQEPGIDNSLGEVKFIFPNQYSVYLHDTPSKGLFADNVRDFSHGCIRVQDTMKLTHYLLRDLPSWGDNDIASVLKSGKEKIITLKNEMPVLVLYFTAWVENGVIQFRKDVYGRDKTLTSALSTQNTNI